MSMNPIFSKYFGIGLLAASTVLINGCSDDPAPGPTELQALYFSAYTRDNGQEVWKTDGTEAGTVMVKEINPTGDSNPASFVEAGGNVFFVADDRLHGRELWVKASDGTTRLIDINPAAIGPEETSDSHIANMTAHGARVFFTANDGTNGNELWVSDGTVGGTSMVVDLTGDELSADIAWLASKPGGDLYFILNGSQLWRSNGTAAGTTQVATDAFTGATSLIAVGDNLFFHAQNQLWLSNGTNGAALAVVGNLQSYARFMNLGGKLLFRIGGTYGALWVSDGTVPGTFRLREADGLTVYAYGTYPYSGILQAGNVAYFVNYGGPGNIRQLWRTDGTDAGTVEVTNKVYYPRLLAGTPDGKVVMRYNSSLWSSDGTDVGTQDLLTENPQACASTADKTFCFLNVDQYSDGYELWLTDGSFDGTTRVAGVKTNQYVSENDLYGGSSALYFAFDDNVHGREPWVSDGTEAGSSLLANVNTLPTNSAYPWLYLADSVEGPRSAANNQYTRVSINNNLYFIASDGIHGEGLWKTDGTEAGTTLVKDINPNGHDNIGRMLKVGNRLYFRADDGEHGTELWVTDGSEAGTTMVFDGESGRQGSYPRPWADFNGKLIFSLEDTLWITDGTSAGTDILDILIYPRKVVVAGDKAIIIPDGEWTDSLVVTDGTFEGTEAIDNSDNGPYLWGSTYGYALLNDEVYFPAYDDNEYLRLWKSDGTLEGTRIVKEINTNDDDIDYNYQQMMVYKDAIYFAAYSPDNGLELWKTDGTGEGTVMVKDIAADTMSSQPYGFSIVNDALVFTANDNMHGRELWTTDGTTEGTAMLKEITVDSTSYSIGNFYQLGGNLYFTANDYGDYGREMWRTDGTAEGTVMLKDIREGTSSSSPYGFMSFGDKLYFTANDNIHGRELWVTDGTTEGTVLLKDIDEGETGNAYIIQDDD